MKIPSQKKLEEITKKLQEIMRIQDWDIDIELLTAGQMLKKTQDIDNLGEAYRNVRYKYARIRLNTEDEDAEKEWYHTLLHELKHIQTTEMAYLLEKLYSLLDTGKPADKSVREQMQDYYEQMMNVSAREFATVYPVTNFIEEGSTDDSKETDCTRKVLCKHKEKGNQEQTNRT